MIPLNSHHPNLSHHIHICNFYIAETPISSLANSSSYEKGSLGKKILPSDMAHKSP